MSHSSTVSTVSTSRFSSSAWSLFFLLALALWPGAGCNVSYSAATFQVVEGVGEIQVVGAFVNADINLVDAQGRLVARGTTDVLGYWQTSAPAGQGYRVRVAGIGQRQESGPVDVFSPAAFSAEAGIEQIYVTGAFTGHELEAGMGAAPSWTAARWTPRAHGSPGPWTRPPTDSG